MLRKRYIVLLFVCCYVLFTFTFFPKTINYYLEGQPFDLSLEEFNSIIPYSFSRVHIWHESFRYYSIAIYFIVPILASYTYLRMRSTGIDFLIIQRKGFKRYFQKSFIYLLYLALIISLIPIVWYLILQLLPLTNAIKYNDDIIPSIDALNIFYQNVLLSRDEITPFAVYYYPIITMTIMGVVYFIFSYAIQVHTKNVAIGIVLPIALLTLIDIASSILFNISVFFDSFADVILFPASTLLYYNGFLLLISLISIMIHYYMRKQNV